MDNFGIKEKVEKYRIKLNNKFENIKSKIILKKIFNSIKKIKLLHIIKYNKNIMKRINININDYKEFSEIYSSILIEIKPVENECGNFINIKKEEDEKYYHIIPIKFFRIY